MEMRSKGLVQAETINEKFKPVVNGAVIASQIPSKDSQ
jgi:hypothetical protein